MPLNMPQAILLSKLRGLVKTPSDYLVKYILLGINECIKLNPPDKDTVTSSDSRVVSAG
jgi:hypothetical protein